MQEFDLESFLKQMESDETEEAVDDIDEEYYRNRLQNDLSILISETLLHDYERNIEYLNDDSIITFKIQNDESKYLDILNFVDLMNQKGKKNKCIIEVSNKEMFDKCVVDFNGGLHNNTYVKTEHTNGEEVNIREYLEKEKMLMNMIEPAKDLSPYEKFMYVYNIVKNFKEYKDDDTNIYTSRNLYRILDNEYMVCRGFSNLLGNLLDRLGIENDEYVLNVGDFEKDENDKEIISREPHSMRIIRLVDEKYGINGIYVSDPTNDNLLKADLYVNSLNTFNERNNRSGFNYLSFKLDDKMSLEELFCISDLNEFYKKINIILDSKPELTETKFIIDLLKRIKKFDNSLYENVINKHNISNFSIKNSRTVIFDKQKIQEILYDIGTYIIEMTNKEITGTQVIDCVSYLYKNVYKYSEEEFTEKIQKTIHYNKIAQSAFFPKRTIEKSNGEIIYLNEDNKFDIESENAKSK